MLFSKNIPCFKKGLALNAQHPQECGFDVLLQKTCAAKLEDNYMSPKTDMFLTMLEKTSL